MTSDTNPPPLPPPVPSPLPLPPPSEPEKPAPVVGDPTVLTREPMDGPPHLGRIFETVLRQPGRILHELEQGSGRVAGGLVVLVAAGLGLFGLLLGTFSGGAQLWATPVKIVGGVALSTLICLPSFYIFLILAGASVRLKEACGLVGTGLALTALLLMALAPVVWLFTQATASIGFMGFLAVGFWGVAVGFGLRLILRGARSAGASSFPLLPLWAFLFLIVTLQMSTSLRPILGSSDRFLPGERRFFLEHWVGCALGR